MSQKLVQSYVKESYFVSTIYRMSSVPMIPAPWYYETMVWHWNKETRDRGDLLGQYDSGMSETMAMEEHFTICADLAKDLPSLKERREE